MVDKYCTDCYTLSTNPFDDIHICETCNRLWGTLRVGPWGTNEFIRGANIFGETEESI